MISRLSSDAVAASRGHVPLQRTHNMEWQTTTLNKEVRAEHKAQQPFVVWLTGISGSGKSTIASALELTLFRDGKHTYLLDGDNVRNGLSKDLGFSAVDRAENIRRAGEVAQLLVDAGLVVIAAFISPFASERATVRRLFNAGEFIEVHVHAPLAVAEARDPKGLYKKVRAGLLQNFTGVDSPYEAPLNPELRVDTSKLSVEEAVKKIMRLLTTT